MLSPEAITLLERVTVAILEEPRRLNMCEWGSVFSPAQVAINDKLPPCGTRGCIAGWVQIMGDPTFLPRVQREVAEYGYEDYDFSDSFDTAIELLGIDKEQAERLFFFSGWSGVEKGWPEEFSNAYNNTTSPQKKAEITVRRIRHFIETDGRE